MKAKMLLYFSLSSSVPCSLPSSLAVFLFLALAQLTGPAPGPAEWLWAWLPTRASLSHTPILMCQRWRGHGGWRATLLSSVARVPWGKACGVRVLMLSDLVKSRVTALLPGQEVRSGREEGRRMEGLKGICSPSNTQTSNRMRPRRTLQHTYPTLYM